MKKLLLAVVCCFVMCGCGKKEDFQASNISINVTNSSYRTDTNIEYTLKSVSNYTCNGIKAVVEFKSGNLTVEETIYPSSLMLPLRKDDIRTYENTILNKNYEGYTATFKSIDCFSKSV